ncbi:MAG: PRC-barrel domain-containing protein [Cytophagaceae bacterium]|nr:PRC-barrel domain-containing protein [Cytophagaceae bacterium]
MNSTNLDKENLFGKNVDGAHANFPLRLLTATSIIGDKVENTKGEPIGKIRNIMLNVQYGKIEYIIIEFGGFTGLGEKLFAVPFSAIS